MSRQITCINLRSNVIEGQLVLPICKPQRDTTYTWLVYIVDDGLLTY